MNALQRIFAILLIASAWPMAAHAQEGLPDGTCIPDSQLFGENNKWWYPGEPIEWAQDGLLDSLLALGPDGFEITVESPRKPGYLKTIRYQKFNDEVEVLYVEGDCRFISYDPRTRKNSSRSSVVGHTYGAVTFLKDGVLQFQNGRSNWHIHSQRLWHSRVSGEIHESILFRPDFPAELASLHACDSGVFFFLFGQPGLNSEVPIYFYHEEFNSWLDLGVLNPDLKGGSSPNPRFFELADYWIEMRDAAILLRRKSDGFGALVPSETRVWMRSIFETLKEPNLGRVLYFTGNQIHISYGQGWRVIDADALSLEAHWLPVAVAAPKKSTKVIREFVRPEWVTAALILVFGMILTLNQRKRHAAIQELPPVQESGTPRPLSNSTRMLMKSAGSDFSAEQLDEFFELSGVESPETRRSRRSQLVKLINTESQARFGKDLIVRDRHPSDRRVMVYRIEHLSH